MCALVFGAVAGVAESLEAAGVLANVGFLSRVAPQVDLQVLQTGERLGAALKLTKRKEERFSYKQYQGLCLKMNKTGIFPPISIHLIINNDKVKSCI